MNAEVYQISFSQFDRMIGAIDSKPIVLSAAKLANEILVVMYEDGPICYLGIVPPTILSDNAYIWMISTPYGEAHPYIFGRYGKKIMETILQKYRVIFGDCFSPKSVRWLKRIGAEFTSETRFEFRRG